MSFYVDKIFLKTDHLCVDAFVFEPQDAKDEIISIFTHGYTSHKGSILTWAQKMMELGIPCVLFDLPGHKLGGNSKVPNLEVFTNETPRLFLQAKKLFPQSYKAVVGGHSLGALMALKYSSVADIKAVIGVGLGLDLDRENHIFESEFFKETMTLRSQLVSNEIPPKKIFPWISSEKSSLKVDNKRIHLITGQDDLVVGRSAGTQNIINILDAKNTVTSDFPKSLPHHQPERAGVFIKKFFQTSILKDS